MAKFANGLPVNELGEVVVTSGVGSSNIVGTLPPDLIPVDNTTGGIKLNKVALLETDAAGNVVGITDGNGTRLIRSFATWASRPATGVYVGMRARFDDIEGGRAEFVWDGARWANVAPVKLIDSAAGWSRIFDGATDTTKVALLGVKIPGGMWHEGASLHISYYATDVGTGTKNLLMGFNDLSSTFNFSAPQISSGVGYFHRGFGYTRGNIFPKLPNQNYASGSSNNAAIGPNIDLEIDNELLFYVSAPANLSGAESVSLEHVLVEIR